MLYASIGQGWLFLLLLDMGLCAGLFDEIFRLVPFCCKRIKYTKKQQKSLKNTENSAKIVKKIEFLMQNKSNMQKDKPKQKRNLHKIFTPIIDFLRTILLGVIFFFAVLFFNYGEVRLYLIIAFIVGFCLERTFIAKCVQKVFSKCYNRGTI